ncbi:hypothetical protein [Kutzneria kofuensis]|uniref:hypothetical protein n=1 Tax=Kutzneria kofuensis TaxID=103725 RepID=UPI0031EC95D0
MWDGDRDVFHPDREEVAHFYRFQELKHGRRYRTGDTPQSGPTGDKIAIDYDGVLPMRRNPRTSDHPEDSPIRAAQQEFNNAYCLLLSCWTDVQRQPVADGRGGAPMYVIKAQAQVLMKMPTGDGTTAGPTFEYVPPEQRS